MAVWRFLHAASRAIPSNLPDVQGREVLNLGGNLSENTNIDFLGIHAAQ